MKCSQVRPSCWRCSQGGVECIYSPFRTIGRPPKQWTGSLSTSINLAPGHAGSKSLIRDDTEYTRTVNPKRIAKRSNKGQSLDDLLTLSTGIDVMGMAPEKGVHLTEFFRLPGADGAGVATSSSSRIEANPDASTGLPQTTVSPNVSSLAPSGASDGISDSRTPLDSWGSKYSTISDNPSTSFPSSIPDFLVSQPGHNSGTGADIMYGVEAAVGESLSHSSTKVVLEILSHIQDYLATGTDVPLDQLLNLDRSLHSSISALLALTTLSGNDASILLVLMAQDALLAHLEGRRERAHELADFLFLDEALSLGALVLDDTVKTTFLHQIVVGFLEKTSATATQLEKHAKIVAKNVYQHAAQEMAEDIRRRAGSLQGWLQSANREMGHDLVL